MIPYRTARIGLIANTVADSAVLRITAVGYNIAIEQVPSIPLTP